MGNKTGAATLILFCLFTMGLRFNCSAITPADTLATPQTKKLLNNLHKLRTKGVMVGHQDALSYGVGWYADSSKCDFKDACGDYPAIVGYDLGNIELGAATNLDSVFFDNIRSNIKRAYKLGAINTISWHARNPITGSDAWDISSDQVVKSILPGGLCNGLFNQWLDALAGFMLSLKGENGELIPIIFRPYHEMTGSWFWWGKKLCTKNDYKALWQYTVDYLRSKGVHNLLLAYSLADYRNEEEFLDRYPGNSYVDIVGFDSYQTSNDSDASRFKAEVNSKFDVAARVAQSNHKLLAVTETGYESIPDSSWFTQTLAPLVEGRNASYVLLWRNAFNKRNHFYGAYPGHPAAKDFRKMVDAPTILTCKKIGSAYQ